MTQATAKTNALSLPRVPKGLAGRVAWCIAALPRIAKAAGLNLQIIGAKRASTSGGAAEVQISPGGDGEAVLPLNVDENGVVTPGTIGGVMPTISGTALDDATPPVLTIGSSGTKYVIANITGTFSSSTLGSATFIGAAMSSISVTITVTSTALTDADARSTSGSFKLLLATFQDGVKTAQNGYGPLGIYIQDALNGSGTGLLVVTYPG